MLNCNIRADSFAQIIPSTLQMQIPALTFKVSSGGVAIINYIYISAKQLYLQFHTRKHNRENPPELGRIFRWQIFYESGAKVTASTDSPRYLG